MNVEKLKYAVTVAKYGSFREAARQLYMSQSSLSSAIKELEDYYQIQIFERTRKGVIVTEAGNEFLSYAEDILAQVDVLEKRYLEPYNKKSFSVSCQHYDFASEAFAQLVNERTDDQWDFRFLETSTQQVLKDVHTAYSELGIIYINDNNQKVINQYLSRYDLVFTSLGQFTPYVFLGRNHPLAQEKSLVLDDLKNYPVIRFQQSKGSSVQFTEEAIGSDFEGQDIIYASDRASVINLLMNTDAYLIGSGIVTSPFREVEVLIPLRDQAENVSQIGYIQARYRKLSPAGQRYITLLQKMVDGGYNKSD